MLTVPTTPGIGLRFVGAGLGLLWAIDKPFPASPAEEVEFEDPRASSPSLPKSLLAIARGLFALVEAAEPEVEGSDAVDGTVDALAAVALADGAPDSDGAVPGLGEDSCASPALYEREEELPIEALEEGAAAPLLDSPFATGRFGDTVGFVAPGVVSTPTGACLIGALGLEV